MKLLLFRCEKTQIFCFVLLLASEAPTRSCSDPPDRERGDTKYYFDVGFCVLFPF